MRSSASPTTRSRSDRERPDVLGPEHHVHLQLAREAGQLGLGTPAAHLKRAAAAAQRVAQVGQRFEQELRARAGRVPPVHQPLVQTEHGNDVLGTCERLVQRRVIVEAQIAPQPEKRGHPSSSATAARR